MWRICKRKANLSHSDITIDALYAGKHVMCEKPMAKSAEDASKMVEAAKAINRSYQNDDRSVFEY